MNIEQILSIPTNSLVCAKQGTDNHHLYQDILKRTDFLDNIFTSKIPFKVRLHHIKANKYDVPKCGNCGGYTTFNKATQDIDNPYNEYCSSGCRSTGRRMYTDKDWLIHQHHTLKKSADRIGNENGTSSVPVVNAMKRFGIKHINYNKSISHIRKSQTARTPEKELVDFISNVYGGEIKTSDRSLLASKEIDIHIPEKNLAIEFNGANKIDKNYHIDKTNSCDLLNTQLIHVHEHIWKNKSEIYKSIISGKLGCNDKVFARKCSIVEPDRHTTDDFLNKNHIQGTTKNQHIFIGLEFKSELVCVMTFTKSRYNKQCEWEMVRFCNKMGTNVVGGASRVLKRFRMDHKGSIVSYADRSYSNGGLYHTLGFDLVATNKPRYTYIKNDLVISRYQSQRKFLTKLLDNFDPNVSEMKNMINHGYNVVYDSGTYTFILK